jgi:hypothetical protein
MHNVLILTAAIAAAVAGAGWLALSMEPHWQQVCGGRPASAVTVRLLRALGALAWLASLLLCLWADHASMAALVWVMSLAGSALTVAFTLSWRPRWLAPLVAWARH